MITEYFKWQQSLTRLLETPAGPHLAPLSEEMKAQGFSYWILRRRLQGAAHFSDWNERQDRSIEQLHENMLAEFETHLSTCRCHRPLRLSGHDDVKLLAGAQALGLLAALRRHRLRAAVAEAGRAAYWGCGFLRLDAAAARHAGKYAAQVRCRPTSQGLCP